MMTEPTPWALKGELMLSCNCTVFCPCVISLGQHPPTEGYCMTWGGVRVDEGNFGDLDLSGRIMGLMMEIPGLMSRGNWKVALYVDDGATEEQVKALTEIMTGRHKGPPQVIGILTGEFLGTKQKPISYELDGDVRRFSIPKTIEGEIAPIPAADGEGNTCVDNSQYWIAPKIIVSRALKSRYRDFGRNWDFRGRSAEICAIDWRGP